MFAIVITVVVYFVLVPIAYFSYLLFVPSVEDFFNNKPITGEFDFTKLGYSKEFRLRTVLWSSFDLIMESSEPYFPKDYDFQGKVLMEIYSKNRLIQKQELDSIKLRYYAGKSMDYFKALTFKPFNIPLKYRFNQELNIKLTVLQPDIQLSEFKNLRIKISRFL